MSTKKHVFRLVIVLSVLISHAVCNSQTITKHVPSKVKLSQKYLFYLHGGIVQSQGENAVSPVHGPYEYLNILNKLNSYGFHIISEVRPKTTQVKKYAIKVSHQIETLLNKGIPPQNIIVVGASLGAYIALEASKIVKNDNIKYVVLGLCGDYGMKQFLKFKREFVGNFFSIYERSDEKGSCNKLFNELSNHSNYKEIELKMGLGHGFLYKPYKEWVDPLVSWINKTEL